MRTTDELLNVIIAALPYSNQITDIDTESEEEAVRFTWRGTRFRVHSTIIYHTEEVQGGCLVGSNAATLLGELLRRAAAEKENPK